MKSLLNKFKWLRIVVGVVFVVLGIVTLVLALNGNDSDITKTLCIVVGIACLLIGAFSVIISLIVEAKTKLPMDLITGALFIGLGIAIFIDLDVTVSVLQTVVTYCIPWILVAIGSVMIIKAIVLLITKSDVPSWVLALVFGAVALTVGILFWVNRESLGTAIYSILAIVIILIGTLEIIAGIIETIKSKKATPVTNEVVVTEEPKQIESKKKSKK